MEQYFTGDECSSERKGKSAYKKGHPACTPTRWVLLQRPWSNAVPISEMAHHDGLDGFNPDDRVIVIKWINQAANLTARRNREQVTQTFPVLLPSLARCSAGIDNLALIAAIDDGVPLIDTLAAIANVKKETVRFLRGTKAIHIGQAWAENPFVLLKCIDAVPRHRRPVDAHDWEVLWVLWQGSISAMSSSALGLGDFEMGFHRWYSRYSSSLSFDDYLGEWSQYLFAGLCSIGYKNAENLLRPYLNRGDCWNDLSGFIRSVGLWCERSARNLGFNAQVADMARDNLTFELLMRYSVIKLFEFSAQWRQAVAHRQALAAKIANWPPLLPEPLHNNGLSVFSLTDFSQLAEEGHQLNHCASSHTGGCLLGHSHILSIQNGAGERLSTVEIALEENLEGALVPVVVQHYGAKNSEPSSSCAAALAATVLHLKKPERQDWFRRMTAKLAEREDEIERYFLYESSDVTVDVISDILPRIEDINTWLQARLIQEDFWYRHRNELVDEAAEKVGLGDLHYIDSFEAWWSDSFRWQQFERVSGREQFF